MSVPSASPIFTIGAIASLGTGATRVAEADRRGQRVRLGAELELQPQNIFVSRAELDESSRSRPSRPSRG